MAKVSKSYRLDEGTVVAVKAYARARGSSETDVMEAAARAFLGLASGGVPDLPAEPDPVPAAKLKLGARIVRASKLSPASPVASTRQAQLNKAKAS